MSELDDRYVKHGFWINWSQGSLMGRTLTVDARTGNIVVAILTILATIGTAQLWHLLVFIYHQWRANGSPADGLFWQQQALLRTLPTPTALLADYLKLWWAWKSKTHRAYVRSVPSLLFSMFFAIAAIASGILTSYIVTTANLEVLVNSPMCGYVNFTSLIGTDKGTSTIWSNLTSVVRSYTEACYQDASVPATCRNIFTKPRIKFGVEPAPCPWQPSMCPEGDLPAIAMDSGLLDVAEQFGLNLEQHDKMINASDLSIVIARDTFPGEKAIALRYGTDARPAEELPEYTFVHSTLTSNITPTYSPNIEIRFLNPETDFGLWKPYPEMQRSDADIALCAIWFNAVKYWHPVEEPFFSAHKPGEYLYYGKKFSFYRPDELGRAIGCTEQYQFCVTQPKGPDACSSLSGLPKMTGSELFPQTTPIQLAILRMLTTAGILNDISNAPDSNYVKASTMLYRGFIDHLPNDQWIKELIAWENFAWAGIMTMISDTAVGPKLRDAAADDYTDAPTSAGEKQLCKAMKMRKSGNFANINVFGLSFVIAFCSSITVFNFFILRFVIFLSRFRRPLAPRIERWVNDGVFQLQRRAFEGNGEGIWKDTEEEVPVTTEKELLRELPIATFQVLPSVESGMTSETQVMKDENVNILPLHTNDLLPEDSEDLTINVSTIKEKPTEGQDQTRSVGAGENASSEEDISASDKT